MKCEVCLELLEEYLDAELAPADHEQVDAHLITCTDCSASFAALSAEQDIFAHYDRDVEVPPFLWTRVAAHTVSENNVSRLGWRKRLASLLATRSVSFAGAIAVLLIAIAVGVVYLISREAASKTTIAVTPQQHPNTTPKTEDRQQPTATQDEHSKRELVAVQPKPKRRTPPVIKQSISDQSDVLSSDVAYLDMDEQDTVKHIEQTQILLRSIKNVSISDGDDEIDVTYDKALSRRLLNENVVLRRDAEMKAKFPTKTLLADLEPFLIDIANLPDRARPEDVRVIKERVQKTEIVAALMDYRDRGPNNR